MLLAEDGRPVLRTLMPVNRPYWIDKRPTGFDGHLRTIALRLTSQRVSFLHFKIHFMYIITIHLVYLPRDCESTKENIKFNKFSLCGHIGHTQRVLIP